MSVPKKEREGLPHVKEKNYVDELLRSGILVKIMAQVHECEAGGAKRLENAMISIHRRSPTV